MRQVRLAAALLLVLAGCAGQSSRPLGYTLLALGGGAAAAGGIGVGVNAAQNQTDRVAWALPFGGVALGLALAGVGDWLVRMPEPRE